MAVYYGWEPFPTELLLEALYHSAATRAEMAALSADSKYELAMIVGASQINFREGSKLWQRFHEWFPTGSQTWTQILAVSMRTYDVSPG